MKERNRNRNTRQQNFLLVQYILSCHILFPHSKSCKCNQITNQPPLFHLMISTMKSIPAQLLRTCEPAR